MYPKKWKVVFASVLTAAALYTSAFAANVTATTSVNVRSGPGKEYPVITVMRSGMTVVEYGEEDGWTKVSANGKTGYVASQYLKEASGTETSNSASSSLKQSAITSPSEDSSEEESAADTSSSTGEAIASCVQKYIGYRYSYGSAGPNSFDCSGLTMYVYAQCGISIPRSSSAQYASCPTRLSKSQLQPGDLIFFSSSSGGSSVGHVGIYIGNGNMVHAANSSRGVVIDSINSTYYTKHYVGCGRYY